MKQKFVSQYYKEKFGCKVYKLCLDVGMTCPNRDGTVGYGGCTFCSASGGGDFAEKGTDNIALRLEQAKKRVEHKNRGGKYIAYFQAFSNTYAPLPLLRKLYLDAIAPEYIVALDIATRPDCINDETVDLLRYINTIKPVTVELGLQTANNITAKRINRGYDTEVFLTAVKKLKNAGIETVAHMIIGLPGENEADAVKTARLISDVGTDGIKFHLLHILKGSALEREYYNGTVKTLSLEEYTNILQKCISALRDDIIIHRLTGDGSKKELIAPLWSANKKVALNYINNAIGGLNHA